MEYNLEKTLDFDINYESPNDFNIDLFEDFMPGIGQIVPFDNIIVPLYNHSDLTTIIKENNLEVEQSGGGLESDDELNQNSEDQLNEVNTNENPNKRKIIDEAIQNSFMHPKMFKTKIITLDTASIEKPKKNVSQQLSVESPKMSFKKHKFKIY